MKTETSPVVDVKDSPVATGEQDNAQAEREQHEQDLKTVFGSRYEDISEVTREKLLAARKTDPRVEKLLSWGDSEFFEQNPDKAQEVMGMLTALAEEDEEELDEEPASWLKRFSANARYQAARPLIWLASRNANFREKYNNATPEEKAKMERKANIYGTIGAVAAAAAFAVWKTDVLGGLTNGSGSAHDNTEGITVKQAAQPTHNEGAGGAYDHGLTPEQLFEASHKQEMDFLQTNGRVNNDFNNIPVDSVNSPEHKHLFPGFDALQNQYQKSPTELSAQLHQILSIEMAKGHTFDMIPKEFQLHPGESQEAFVARLSDVLHKDDSLHSKLVGATMEYLEKNGKAQDLTQSYGSWYITTENGQTVAHFDSSVTSADPNDKVIMLSATEGIRLPCGQPIRLHAPAQIESPVYVEQPNYQPRGGGSTQHIIRTPSTPRPPVDQPPIDRPPVDNPPVDEPPIDNPPVDNPPVLNPKSSDINDYQRPGTDDTTDSGVGVKPQVGPDALTPPPRVEQQAPASQPNRGPNFNAPSNSSTNAPGSESGTGRAGNSNPNSGVGQAGTPEGTGGSTNNGSVNGPAE